VHGVEGSGIVFCSEAFDQGNGSVHRWFPGDGVTKPNSVFEFVSKDLPGFAPGMACASDKGAACFEFSESTDQEGEG
jgi:hypothetical protein